ncbi:hypothetical protein DRO45_02730 [Candidatus Bathyarchaeota archaeon]|nr:MAG: hypothetical protein DRO45_02730 [Candidatus Bathyarchaeota archaeon]
MLFDSYFNFIKFKKTENSVFFSFRTKFKQLRRLIKGCEILDEFDELLLKTIDETLRYTFGDVTTEEIYRYLRRKSCPRYEIPRKPDVFSTELRRVLEFEKGISFHRTVTVLSTVSILERVVVKKICSKLGVEFNEKGPIDFAEWVKKLREVYNNGENRSP